MLTAVRNDLRHSLRLLTKRPGHTASVVLTLALGIGVNTAVFSIVDRVLLDPVPYPEPDRLVDLLASRPQRGPERFAIYPADFLEWKEKSTSFEHLGAYDPLGTLDLTDRDEPVRLSRFLVSEGLLEALRVQPIRGRLFSPEDYQVGAARRVLLSHRFWARRFGKDPDVLGRDLPLSGESYTILGVLPEGFRIPGGSPQLLLPLAFRPEDASDRESAQIGAIGRLAHGTTLEQASAELHTLRLRYEQDPARGDAGLVPSLKLLREAFIGETRTAILAIFGAVGFVLLLACTNVAHLHLGKALGRSREMALRTALGATSGRLVGQSLVESCFLAMISGAGGLVVAQLAIELFPDVRGVYLPSDVELALDVRTLGFTFAISWIVGLLSGTLPACWVSRVELLSSLQAGGKGGSSGPRHKILQNVFVASEVALACMLLVGAGLAIRSFQDLHKIDHGFEPKNLLSFEISLPESRYAEPERVVGFYRTLLDRIRAIPGVEAVGAAKELPPETAWDYRPAIEGREPAEEDSAGWQVVTPGYFTAMDTAILQGRALEAQDRAGAPRVAVVNEAFAEKFLPQDAIGRRIRFHRRWHEVVGVVETHRLPGPSGAEPITYVAHSQNPVPVDFLRSMAVGVRTAADPLLLAPLVRSEVSKLDRALPTSKLQSMEQRLAGAVLVARTHFHAVLLITFALLAAVLAAIGIYGVLSYAVRQRTHEFGIRMAQGALRGDLFRLVLHRGMGLVTLGMVIGTLGAWALALLAVGKIYGVSRPGPLLFCVVALFLGVVSFLACFLPALRASRTDPSSAIRTE